MLTEFISRLQVVYKSLLSFIKFKSQNRINSKGNASMYPPRFELVALNKPHCTVHGCIENSNQPHQRRNFAHVIRIPHSRTWISRGLRQLLGLKTHLRTFTPGRYGTKLQTSWCVETYRPIFDEESRPREVEHVCHIGLQQIRIT